MREYGGMSSFPAGGHPFPYMAGPQGQGPPAANYPYSSLGSSMDGPLGGPQGPSPSMSSIGSIHSAGTMGNGQEPSLPGEDSRDDGKLPWQP